jgi:uncharacterized protein YcaQ
MTASGQEEKFLIHKNNLELLQKVSEGGHAAQRTTLLSPFDSLFWAKGRDSTLFNFNQVLECYKPKKLRKWGYFCMPILDNGSLIGRLDPKLDRVSNTMYIKSLYLESGVRATERLVTNMSVALRDFLEFHGAKNIVFGKTGSQSFITQLEQTL